MATLRSSGSFQLAIRQRSAASRSSGHGWPLPVRMEAKWRVFDEIAALDEIAAFEHAANEKRGKEAEKRQHTRADITIRGGFSTRPPQESRLRGDQRRKEKESPHSHLVLAIQVISKEPINQV